MNVSKYENNSASITIVIFMSHTVKNINDGRFSKI